MVAGNECLVNYFAAGETLRLCKDLKLTSAYLLSPFAGDRVRCRNV